MDDGLNVHYMLVIGTSVLLGSLQVDWIIATGHNLAAKVPDCARIRKDLERRGCCGAGGWLEQFLRVIGELFP